MIVVPQDEIKVFFCGVLSNIVDLRSQNHQVYGNTLTLKQKLKHNYLLVSYHYIVDYFV